MAKRRKPTESEMESDRISNLPGSLIGHILSFLPTKDAVKTSVLSTHWKLHWTSISNLDIEDETPDKVCNSSALDDGMSFLNFVYRVLLLCRAENMNKFRLCCWQDVDVSHVNSWVAAVLSRNVKEFDILVHLKGPGSGFVSRNLLNCGNLVVLELGSGFHLNVPSLFCLPRLKILNLNKIRFADDESLARFFQSCPLLDDLKIVGHVGKDVRVVHIIAPLLTRLTMFELCGEHFDDFYEEDDDDNYVMYKILINTPSLRYLDACDDVPLSYSLQKFEHLEIARIGLRHSANSEVDLPAFFEAISEIRVLYITRRLLELIRCYDGQIPMLHRVTVLRISHPDLGNEWDMLPNLLHLLPNLEILDFEWGITYDLLGKDGPHIAWDPPGEVPSCLRSCLRHNKLGSETALVSCPRRSEKWSNAGSRPDQKWSPIGSAICPVA